MTILVVAHHMGFVSRISDQVVCLVSGEVISSGTAEEVQSDPKVLAAYMGT
jgi:branched-chain amino acid transport system ATP-binding protein